MSLDIIASLGGLVVPPVFDIIKKIFVKKDKDTPEATMSSLATTKPEILPDYLNAVVGHLKAKIDWFNRDVIGIPSQWVVNLRAAIRPTTVIIGLVALVIPVLIQGFLAKDVSIKLDPGTRYFFEAIISSWFGDRLNKKDES